MIGIIKDCIGIGFQWKIETDIDVTGVKNIVDKLQELMTITMEECGELIQQCSKAIRCDNYRDNEKLTEEVVDYAKVEVPPKSEGKQIMMILVPQLDK